MPTPIAVTHVNVKTAALLLGFKLSKIYMLADKGVLKYRTAHGVMAITSESIKSYFEFESAEIRKSIDDLTSRIKQAKEIGIE